MLEVYTIQTLPLSLREKEINAISSFAKENGELIAVGHFCETDEEPECPPWALSLNDLALF